MAEKKTRSRRGLVVVAKALPEDIPIPPEPALPGAAQLHAALDQANIRHLEVTEELRELKSSWARRNLEANQCHQSIPAKEIAHIETQRRELQSALMETQSEIARCNKVIRERKAIRQAVGTSVPREHIDAKPEPEADYFRLAARNELDPETFSRIERIAEAMRHDAESMGVD